VIASSSSAPGSPLSGDSRARAFLDEGRQYDQEGRLDEAADAYERAIGEAERGGAGATLAEALRALGITRHRLGDAAKARALVSRSRDVAQELKDRSLGLQALNSLEAQALNTLAVFDLTEGHLDAARSGFREALRSGIGDVQLVGRIEQNLGIIANIKGELATAQVHYENALTAFRSAQDERGCAMAYNGIGYVHAQQKRWEDAERCYVLGLEIATRLGDLQQRGQILLTQAETQIARERYVAAQRNAEEALRIFDKLGVVRNKSEAYRVLGVIYRLVDRKTLAEARLQSAMQLAKAANAPLAEAEATREMAQLFRDLGRNQDALRMLNTAYRLFGALDARADLFDIASRVEALEGTYLSIVHDWGQSIESADSYTHGHCERVAEYGVAVGRQLGLDAHDLTTLRLGAYLHDLGKVRIPHEILNKPGKLTAEEFELIKRHPIDGVELLEGIEFPWDIFPIIRSHHERDDGTGYPDGLRGEQIPLNAQIICIVDVYDALTTTRSYRGAMTHDQALGIIMKDRHWWRASVYEAFMRVNQATGSAPEQGATQPLVGSPNA
jgi:putative nucleotidyltransferase with HDIG domain